MLTGYDKEKIYYIHLTKGLKSINNDSLKKMVIPFMIENRSKEDLSKYIKLSFGSLDYRYI